MSAKVTICWQNRRENLFYSVTVFSHLPISLKSLPVPTASTSYDKKRWFLSGISHNNSWISKRFVKTYMQIIATFQRALGTELTVETWLTVAQRIWYWVVRPPVFTFCAVGKFKFYLCRVIKCMFYNIILCIQHIRKTLSFISLCMWSCLSCQGELTGCLPSPTLQQSQ